MINTSVPTIEEYDPSLIPYQKDVVKLIRKEYDYDKGALEILLSGSVGCLREDALVETVYGATPIGDITEQDYLLTFCDKNNQFGLTQGSGAYLKGKGTLYRVISEHGEYVASADHLIFSSNHTYQKIQTLYDRGASFSAPYVHVARHHEAHQKLFALSVLNCWQIVANLMDHCVKRIHQCGQRLPEDLVRVLTDFPLQVDAHRYGLFFYKNKHEHGGAPLVQEQEPCRHAQSPFHLSMRDFFHHLENKTEAVAGACTQGGSKPYGHKIRDNLTRLLYHSHSAHPQDLLFFLSKICNALYSSLKSPIVSVTDSTYTIEKLPGQDWYWDMQVPNTNSYIANGGIHHNSGKSLVLAHIIATHAIMYPGAGVLVGRRTLKDLKNTIWTMIMAHCPQLYQYWNKSEMKINLPNGSTIFGVSWDDGRYDKFRSYELSLAAIEELTENRDQKIYDEIKMRLGRCQHVKENVFINATNPDSPSHWAHSYFIEKESDSRKVVYSKTSQNPFLPRWYLKQLKEDLDPKMAMRMLEGKWIEITKDMVYYNFDAERNTTDKAYKWHSDYPICIMHDFNIGKGKPMSAAAGQYIDGVFHIGIEFIIEGARTADIMDEMAHSGIFDLDNNHVHVYGDASGKNNDTRSLKDDYAIIEKYLSNYKRRDGAHLEVLLNVPRKNPPIRRRHNIVNACFFNENKEVKIILYKQAKKAAKGFRLVQFKGANMIEDDSLPEQHVTTAIGYWVDFTIYKENGPKSRVIQL